MLPVSQQFGRFRIESKLGEGGMGVVYRCFDTQFNRTVALKILRPDLYATVERRTRFAHEARATARLHHPHIVTVHDIGREQGFDFICMEYVEGETLEQRIQRRRLSIDEALRYAIALADALGTAHAAGIVHRDVKPANILITTNGRPKLMDFGLAKFSGSSNVTEFAATRTLCTQEGQILGTVSYMSPEQAQGRLVDARSDIFSFGCVLYEMITARRAFDSGSNLSTLADILRASPTPLGELAPAASRELEEVIDKCLDKNPGRRFGSMSEVKTALEAQLRIESGKLTRWGNRRWMAALKLALALMAGFAVMWWVSSHLRLADIYLFCFLVGFGFSVLAALSGSFHMHVHGVHGGAAGLDGTQAPQGSSAISGFNAGTVAAFVAWFGGTGFVLAEYFGLGLATTYLAAVAGGLAGAALIFLFLTKGLLREDQDLNPADYDLVGVTGRLSSPIVEGGTGEIIFSLAGTRRASSARSADGMAIPRGAQVLVIRYERAIADVRTVTGH